MANTDKYLVELSKLPLGLSKYEFELGKQFFVDCESFDIEDAQLKVKLDIVRREANAFELNFAMKGLLATPCDRCLELVSMAVESVNEVTVQLVDELIDESRDDDDKLILLQEQPGELDLTQLLYEFAELSLPIQRFHDEGECEAQMMDRLNTYRVEEYEADDADPYSSDAAPIDSRWEALAKLKNENNEQ